MSFTVYKLTWVIAITVSVLNGYMRFLLVQSRRKRLKPLIYYVFDLFIFTQTSD